MIQLQASSALLGIYLCAVGAVAGRKFVSLRIWMGVSSVCGVASMWLWAHGMPNQFVSNSWVLLNVLVLLPYVSILCIESLKPIVYVLVGFCAWMFFVHCMNHGISEYAPGLRVAVSLSIAAACALAAFNGENRVLLITLCMACLVDAVLYSFSLEWFRFNTPHKWRTYRNLLWCGVYLAMGYTVRRR